MLLRSPGRTVLALLGMGIACALALTQVGLLVGWIHTTSALIRHAPADVWVMAEQTPAFDYGTAIPGRRIHQVRSVAGVAWAEGLFMAWNIWQRPDGRRVNVELVGLDDSLAGGPWDMAAGTPEVLREPDAVIVDQLFLQPLGVTGLDTEVELLGRRARVRGISRGVRTFTASPFVFTTLDRAVAFDGRYRPGEITYVLARSQDGVPAEALADRIRAAVPDVEVLTSRAFVERTVRYWMLETGVGITVVLTALLGLVIGVFVAAQALYATVRENLQHFATLRALGTKQATLSGAVIVQGASLGMGGAALGTSAFLAASHASQGTPIPLETSPSVHAALCALFLVVAVLSSLLAIRVIGRADPASVFSR